MAETSNKVTVSPSDQPSGFKAGFIDKNREIIWEGVRWCIIVLHTPPINRLHANTDEHLKCATSQ